MSRLYKSKYPQFAWQFYVKTIQLLFQYITTNKTSPMDDIIDYNKSYVPKVLTWITTKANTNETR